MARRANGTQPSLTAKNNGSILIYDCFSDNLEDGCILQWSA